MSTTYAEIECMLKFRRLIELSHYHKGSACSSGLQGDKTDGMRSGDLTLAHSWSTNNSFVSLRMSVCRSAHVERRLFCMECPIILSFPSVQALDAIHCFSHFHDMHLDACLIRVVDTGKYLRVSISISTDFCASSTSDVWCMQRCACYCTCDTSFESTNWQQQLCIAASEVFATVRLH